MRGWREKRKVRARERAGDGEITDCSCGTSERAQPAASRAEGRCHIFFSFLNRPPSRERGCCRGSQSSLRKNVSRLSSIWVNNPFSITPYFYIFIGKGASSASCF